MTIAGFYLNVGLRDLTAALPPEARKRYRAIADRADDARTLLRSASEKGHEEFKLYQEAEMRFRSLTDANVASRMGNRVIDSEHPSALDAKSKMDRHKAETDRLRELREEREADAEPLVHLLQHLDDYLKRIGEDDRISLHKAGGPAPK